MFNIQYGILLQSARIGRKCWCENERALPIIILLLIIACQLNIVVVSYREINLFIRENVKAK